jgi:hypothetical protein
VSNLPTIVTQTAAAVVIAGVAVDVVDVAALGGGFAAAYVAGMFLNDAFDQSIDSRERPERPIPRGLVDVREVFVVGGALLAVGVSLIALVGARHGHGAVGLVGALGLAAAIVLYDAWHKGNPVGPVIMGACRGLVYVAAALALGGRVPLLAAVAAVAMVTYVTGLSEVARSKHPPRRGLLALGVAPAVLGGAAVVAGAPVAGVVFAAALGALVTVAWRRARSGQGERATVLLLAGLSLVDATLLAAGGHLVLAVLAAVALPVTRRLQALVRGT